MTGDVETFSATGEGNRKRDREREGRTGRRKGRSGEVTIVPSLLFIARTFRLFRRGAICTKSWRAGGRNSNPARNGIGIDDSPRNPAPRNNCVRWRCATSCTNRRPDILTHIGATRKTSSAQRRTRSRGPSLSFHLTSRRDTKEFSLMFHVADNAAAPA